MEQEQNATIEWYTARELAALNLPGLPATESAIIRRAKREDWTARPRAGRGGGQEYHMASLPAPTRSVLLDRLIADLGDTVCALPAVAVPAALPALAAPDLPATALYKGWQRRTMDARCALLNLVEQLAGSVGVTRAIDRVVAHAQAGSLPDGLQGLVPVANARSGGEMGKQTLSRRTLYRWREQRIQGVAALAPLDPVDDPRLPAERRAGARVPAWVPYFLKAWRVPAKLSIPDALEDLAKFLPVDIEMPSYGQAYRLVQKMSALDREKGRRTGKDLKAIKGYRRRDTSDMDPCEVYQCDGHSFKARVAHPVHGKPFHPEVCACVDAATRLAMGWSAGLSESNQTVADALRHACIVAEGKPGGIPAIFYTDPGSGNKANLNADPALGRYARLGITFKTGIVGNSQARGLIEAFQKNWIRAAKRLPTYDGKDMDGNVLYKTTRLVDAQVKKTGRSERLPSWGQFLDHCAEAIEAYNNRPHSALPKIVDAGGKRRHLTPMECWNAHLARGFVPPTLAAVELDDCFRPRIEPTTRRGEVRVFGNVYSHPELEHYQGEKVWVEYEVQDASRVWVRDREERLICIAGFESNKSGMFAQTAREAAAEQREARRLAVVERKRQEIMEERHGVIALAPLPAELSAARAELIAQEQATVEKAAPLPIDDVDRLRLYRQLQRRIEQGELLSDREEGWLKTYKSSREYAIYAELERDLAVAP